MERVVKQAVEKASTIDGWMGLLELDWLYEMGSLVPEDGIVVELGSWHGRSTTAITLGALTKTKNIYAVDQWLGAAGLEDIFPDKGRGALWTFVTNLTMQAGFVPDIIYSDSAKAAERFKDHTVDFLFIDADHKYEAVKADILAWLPKMKKGSLLAGDDIAIPGVANAVLDLLGDKFEKWHALWTYRV
jgi:methyltransferase family protein